MNNAQEPGRIMVSKNHFAERLMMLALGEKVLHQPHKTDKRLVSKSEYVRTHLLRGGMVMVSIFLLCTAALCGLGTLWLLLTFCFLPGFLGDEQPAADPIDIGALLLLITLLGIYLFGKGALAAQRWASAIEPGIPLTRANTAHLAAPDSLVRASAEPVQEPQAVLLRAATEERVERQVEQLVRPASRQK